MTNPDIQIKIEEIRNMISQHAENEKLINLCHKLVTITHYNDRIYDMCQLVLDVYYDVRIREIGREGRLGENPRPGEFQYDPEHGDIFDPEHEDIFDPEHGDIFDPDERFYPSDGISLRTLSEGLYDSYGNRISPNDSISLLMSLLAWTIKWEKYRENPVLFQPDN